MDAAPAGQPQSVSRRGKPAVVVLAASDYERPLAGAGGARGSFLDHLRAFPGDPSDRARVTPRDVQF